MEMWIPATRVIEAMPAVSVKIKTEREGEKNDKKRKLLCV